MERKREIVDFFIRNGVLINNELLAKLDEPQSLEKFKRIIDKINSSDLMVINEDIEKLLLGENSLGQINWVEMEQSRAFSEKGKANTYNQFVEFISKERDLPEQKAGESDKFSVKIVFSYEGELKKWTTEDFVEHFNTRFNSFEKMLRKRQEMKNLVSISRLRSKKDKEDISMIGMVNGKNFTKNGNLIIMLEDSTGEIKVIVNKNKPNLFQEALSIVDDEVIAVQGVASNGVVFVNNITWPDVPLNRDMKKSNDDVFALFLSDLHVGSKYFLAEEFEKFVKWINLEVGDEKQRDIAEKVGYIFVSGDLIDGCGIYPGQEDDLSIKDLKLQYAECARYLAQIPSHIKIIICSGNHDAMRLSEPQLIIPRDYAEELYKLPNIISVSNPSLVNIHAKGDFSGFDVLLYHGYSFDYYVANVDAIRNNGGYERSDLIMKFLLKRRHLAPTHGSNTYVPDGKIDPLIIENVPDIFCTGHIHRTLIANYRGITLINASCWQSMTEYQKRRGHLPEPARVAAVNLKTREARVVKFMK